MGAVAGAGAGARGGLWVKEGEGSARGDLSPPGPDRRRKTISRRRRKRGEERRGEIRRGGQQQL